MGSDRRRRPAGHESRVFIAALLAGLPAVLVAGWLLWAGTYPLRTKVTLSLIVGGAWLIGAALVRERVLRPLQTIANLLAALREGDYSIRARGAHPDDGLSLALLEINTLSDTLRSQRRHALEATALLRRVMEEIDVAIFAFDGGQRLRLVNRGGERLLGRTERDEHADGPPTQVERGQRYPGEELLHLAPQAGTTRARQLGSHGERSGQLRGELG